MDESFGYGPPPMGPGSNPRHLPGPFIVNSQPPFSNPPPMFINPYTMPPPGLGTWFGPYMAPDGTMNGHFPPQMEFDPQYPPPPPPGPGYFDPPGMNIPFNMQPPINPNFQDQPPQPQPGPGPQTPPTTTVEDSPTPIQQNGTVKQSGSKSEPVPKSNLETMEVTKEESQESEEVLLEILLDPNRREEAPRLVHIPIPDDEAEHAGEEDDQEDDKRSTVSSPPRCGSDVTVIQHITNDHSNGHANGHAKETNVPGEDEVDAHSDDEDTLTEAENGTSEKSLSEVNTPEPSSNGSASGEPTFAVNGPANANGSPVRSPARTYLDVVREQAATNGYNMSEETMQEIARDLEEEKELEIQRELEKLDISSESSKEDA